MSKNARRFLRIRQRDWIKTILFIFFVPIFLFVIGGDIPAVMFLLFDPTATLSGATPTQSAFCHGFGIATTILGTLWLFSTKVNDDFFYKETTAGVLD